VNWDKVDITGPVYIGGMTHIEDGAKIIGPTMIGSNCWVCSGATVDNSVIFDYSRLGAGVRLVDKLVFGRYCVDKTGATIDVQAAALDWLITDTRRSLPFHEPAERQAIAELLGSDS
jgi:mannose-1-phosphate guanylyltransferase